MGGGYQQLEMISLLASSNYMNTSLVNGTGTTGVLRGVNRIASEMFGGYRLLEYQGWRKHPKKYSTGSRLPDLDRLKSAISSRSAAWLNVGWYRYHRQKNEYRRIGGHWVTLAGFDEDRLVIHDPAPRAGSAFANEFVEFEVIEDGLLVGDKAGLPVEARGYLKFGNGFHIKRGADFAILDGVVFFAL
ncbi:MAG: peptidase C39 family protein [Candidatus Thiodiazotropha endolucinida]|nr:peptidase C39 family protein [Candidatus Thiodiazotropha taylori]